MGKVIYIDVELEKKKVVKQMKDLEKELEKSTKRTKKNNDITPEVDDKKIKKALDSVKNDFQKFARDTGTEIDKVTFNELQSEITDTKVQLKLLRQAQREVEKADGPDSADYKKLDKEIENVSDSLTEAKRRMKNLKNTGDTTTSRLQKKFDKLGSGINKTFSKIGGIASSAFAAIGGTALVSSLFGSSAEIEQIRTSFNLLIGDAEKAGETMDELADFSSRTSFKFPEVADGGRKLMSVAGIARNELIPTLTALGDIAASQGKGIDQTVEAFNDAITGEFERLKEFGIKASSSGDKVTFSFKGQKTTVDKTSDSIKDYLVELSKAEGISGAMSEQSKTLNGRLSTLKDNFGFLAKAIFGMSKSGEVLEGGVIYYVGKLTTYVGDLVNKYQIWAGENPKLASSIGIITAVLGGLAVAIGLVGLASTLLLPGLVAIGAVLSPILVPILGITAGLTALGYAYKENLGGFGDKVNELGFLIGTVFGFISEKIGLFISYLNEKFGDEIKLIFNGIGEVFSGFINIINIGLEWFNGLFTKSGEEVGFWGNVVKIVFEVVATIFKNLMSVLEFGLSVIGNLFKVFGKVMQGDFKGAFEGVLNIVRSFGNLLKNLFKTTIGGALNIVGNFDEKMAQYGRNLLNSFTKGIKEKIAKLKETLSNVGKAVTDFLGIHSPTKKGPLSKEGQDVWGKNLIKSFTKGVNQEVPKLKKEIENIAGELLELSNLESQFKTKASISKQTSKLNTKLDKLEFGTDGFNETKRQIKLLGDLQKKYNGEKTTQELNLEKIQKNHFNDEVDFIKNKVKLEDKNSKDLLLQFKARRKAVEELNKIDIVSAEQQEKINENILDYKQDMKDISIKIFEEEEKSLKKLADNIEKLQTEAKKITENKDTSIAERKLEIEKERKQVLEDIAKLDNSGSLGNTSDRIQKIDEDLEGNLSEKQRNKLLDKKKVLLEKVNAQILQANNLNGKAYELKKKLLALDNEEKVVDENLNSDSLNKVKTEEGKTKTDKILDKYDEEKKAIEDKLELQIQAYKDDEVAYNDVLKNKAIGEASFTELLSGETNKRISEQARLLDDARRVAAEMAALGFNGNGFTASFKKTDAETGKTTTVNKTINITNNNKVDNSVDLRKQSRQQAKQIARAEASGNTF